MANIPDWNVKSSPIVTFSTKSLRNTVSFKARNFDMWLENTFENEGEVDRLFVREHPFLPERKKRLAAHAAQHQIFRHHGNFQMMQVRRAGGPRLCTCTGSLRKLLSTEVNLSA